MVNLFTFWLEGLVEDDPLPTEVNVILFKTSKNGSYKWLKLMGFENEVNENCIAYFPLEAQCFLNHNLAKLSDAQFVYKVKYLIDECFNSTILKQQFKNRKIYVEINNKIEYLFTIN